MCQKEGAHLRGLGQKYFVPLIRFNKFMPIKYTTEPICYLEIFLKNSKNVHMALLTSKNQS